MAKRISVLLLTALLCAALPIAAQGKESAIRLLEIYGNDMLFQQGQPVRLAGTAPGDTALRAELYQGETLLAYADSAADKQGSFSLDLPAQSGSYMEYRIVLTSEKQPVTSLERVVFGELWLAGGQSNMDWQYGITPEGFRARKAGEVPQEPYVRMLYTPGFPEYQGDGQKLPLLPQEDIKGAAWWRGDSMDAYNFSAVAWHFACELQQALDVPVGVVGASLGGSSIYTWLAREEIEGDPQVKADVAALWRYLPAEGWEAHKDPNHFQDMTVNYNKRIYPLRHFRPTGVIWYQGETELIGYASRGVLWDGGNAYRRALTLLQDSWAALFGVPTLSLATVNLAGCLYDAKRPEQPGLFNAMLGELDATNPNLAAAPIYDVPLNWDITREIDPSLGYTGGIHPYIKRLVGERLALSALGLRYGNAYQTPVVQKSEIQGSSVLLTFNQIGDCLFIKDDTRLRGFTLAGTDGYYHEAEAEIAAPNQLRVSCEGLADPVSAAYAIGLFGSNANLYASFGGESMPAAPFVTQQLPGAVYLRDTDWRSCDFTQTWQKKADPAFVPSFTAAGRGSKISFIADGKAGGAVRLEREKNGALCFGIAPEDGRSDYSREKSVRFYVRNPSSVPVELTGLRFYTSSLTWYSPAVCIEIPAGSGWQEVRVDFDKLYLYGKAFVPLMPGSTMLLKDVTCLELRFEAALGKACTVDLDEFRFTPQQAEDRFGYEVWQIFLALLHPLRTVFALFITLV